jgi:hypothetical protein
MNLSLKERSCEIAMPKRHASFLPALKDGPSARDLR